MVDEDISGIAEGLIAFRHRELSFFETVTLFQKLVDTDIINSLSSDHQKIARRMIDTGVIKR